MKSPARILSLVIALSANRGSLDRHSDNRGRRWLQREPWRSRASLDLLASFWL